LNQQPANPRPYTKEKSEVGPFWKGKKLPKCKGWGPWICLAEEGGGVTMRKKLELLCRAHIPLAEHLARARPQYTFEFIWRGGP